VIEVLAAALVLVGIRKLGGKHGKQGA